MAPLLCNSSVVFFLLLLLLLLPCLLATPSAINDDVLGLIVFKAGLRDPRSSLGSWSEDDESPCSWAGVACDHRSGRVTELALAGLGLAGELQPRGLLQLQSLQRLSLARNGFSGALNPSLARIKTLAAVDLSGNALSGPIPAELFAQCRALRALSLADNALTGAVPASVGGCSALVSLNISSNRLRGSIPSSIWSLYNLKSLDLSFNSFSDELPAGIGKLYKLRTLNLRGNRLSGPVPADIGSCYLLKTLDLSSNLLNGDLPESMQKLSVCSYLSLGSNSLSGQVPNWIGEMKSLQLLDLSRNQFAGRVPDSIQNLTFLQKLDFSENNFTGNLPESIGACRSLLELDFSGNSLMGSHPSWIFRSGLKRISLSGNKMSGMIQIPSDAPQNLSMLDLSDNTFSGEIPLDIKKFHELKLLNLSKNSISGSVPVTVGEIKSLEVLDLSWNLLNGSIPNEIGGLVSLKVLRLDKNSLTGEIPVQIGNCSSLTSLILSENNLTGPIPTAVGNLTTIQTIDLSSNKLTGTLPKQLSNLPHLLFFNISRNLFSGNLPAGNFFNTISPSSLSDNPGLCGSVLNRSCPGVLPKPIVLNPNSSSDPVSNPNSPSDARHKKIIFSISALVAIGAAALITVGVITITVLNIRVRSSASRSTAALALSDDYYSHCHSPATDDSSGKLVMFSGTDPQFSFGAHAILNKDCELGRGGFGTVYKTMLGDGRPVAIKKLTVSSLVKSQEDFERQVNKLGKVRHPNLVAFEGYYWTPSLQLLIYEFVPGGSLYKHLHESSPSNHLPWQERFDIILGTARSLAHLHRHNVIHYNLKSSNILIDGAGEPKVGDYGLAKLLPMLDRYVLSSKVQSALGYMAPEFACKIMKITEKCDVYGFGVLALEIVTGRRPVEYMEDDVVVLCDVVRGALEERRVGECIDERLGGKFPVEEAVSVVKLGLICTSQVPSNRPDMAEVVNILELIRCPQDSPEEELI
ncbi:putative LRR receptor-like serine/threonine-protein kinase IRK [Ananas comosus]|uniref:Putative LRR receptor-like serine/threonine-protein kinase IRK n=1 Tax=Ananas comosus TaxID=4615 RepID=A0A199W543_ANACO|nr:putative LRR receptor-like serine/threonine-protein kinase IRK [Ananas comosus]